MLTLALALMAAPTVAEARSYFQQDASNPSVVQFRNVRRAGADAVCGEVNLPNRQGGFDGFQTFIYFSPMRWVLADGVEYRVRENANYSNTRQLFEQMLYRRGSSLEEMERQGEAMRSWNATRDRGAELLRQCDQ